MQAAVLHTLDWHIHKCGADTTCPNSDLTDAVNLRLKYDHELFHTSPHQVGHVLTSFGLTERKRTNAGWVLLLSQDTRKRIHTLLRRYALRARQLGEPRGLHFVHGPEQPAVGREQIRRRTTENRAFK